MDLKTFWLGWRQDILRFVALCFAALVLGLLINGGKSRARHELANLHDLTNLHNLTDLVPEGMAELAANFESDPTAGPRTVGESWTHRERVVPGQSVWVRNLRGSVTIEPARGDSLEVVAVKTFRQSDPATVTLVTVPSNEGIAVCALWGTTSRCGVGNAYKQHSPHHNDVSVQFTVRVPHGVRINATTVNGAVRVSGASAPVVVGTVNGEVNAETAKGPVNAFSVNGGVHATMRGFADTGTVKLVTVNGGVTVELPARVDATVDANTVNGSIQSDFPLTMSGKVVTRHATGTIGTGGRRIELHVVNGSIHLKKVGPLLSGH